MLLEKDHTISQMKETIEILELKIKKLEQLVKLKDSKIANLSGKLQSMGIIQWVFNNIDLMQLLDIRQIISILIFNKTLKL